MLICISTAQAHTKCVLAFWAQTGPRHCSCKFLYKVAVSSVQVSYINLAKRTFLESLHRGFIKRSCAETLHRYLLRSCQEAPGRDLAKRPLLEILLQRSCQDTSYGELVPRHCIEILLQRSCQEGLLHKSCQENSPGDLVQDRDLAKRSEVLLEDNL